MIKKFLVWATIINLLIFPCFNIFQTQIAQAQTDAPTNDTTGDLADDPSWTPANEDVGDWTPSTFDDVEINQIEPLLKTATNINNLSDGTSDLSSLFDMVDKQKLIIPEQDLDEVKAGRVDERLLQSLMYLVRPISDKGAGFERIKVKRLVKNYATEKRALSRESEYENENEINVSAHYNGQAADISEVDIIRMKKVTKKKFAGFTYKAKTENLSSVPINIAWQSEEGKGEGVPGFYGNTANELFNNLSQEKIKDILGDYIDYNLDNLQGDDIPSWAKWLGVIVLFDDFDMPEEGIEEGNDFNGMIKNMGRATIAEKLKIDKDGIQGQNREELILNIGRSYVEKKLELDSGSLKGENWEEIFQNAGKRKMEKQLKMKPYNLDATTNDGRAIIEEKLRLKQGSFKGTIEQVYAANPGWLEILFADDVVNDVDSILKLEKGTTAKLKNKQISVDDYANLVGKKSFSTKQVYEKIKGSGSYQAYGSNQSKDEALDVPEGAAEEIEKESDRGLMLIGAGAILYALSAKNKDEIIKSVKNNDSLDFDIKSDKASVHVDLDFDNLKKLGSRDKNTRKDAIKAAGEATLDAIALNPDISLGLTKKDFEKIKKDQMKMDDLVMTVGARKYEMEFGLPNNSLYYTIKSGRFDDFVNNIGRASLEEKGKHSISDTEKRKEGQEVLRQKIVKQLNKQYKLTEKYQKYELTEDDIVAFFRGDWQIPASKIASHTLDKTLGLPEDGTMDMITGFKSPEQVIKESGAIRLGKVLGLRNPVSLEGDLKKNYGQEMVEEKLGLKRHSFEGNIDEVNSINGGLLDMLFQPDSIKDLDAIFGIKTGTSQKLKDKKISVDDYSNLVANKGLSDLSLDKVADYLNLQEKYKISEDDFKATINTLVNWGGSSDPDKNTALNNLGKVAFRSWDSQFEFEPDTTSKVAENPENPLPGQTAPKSIRERATNLLLQQGIRKLNNQIFGIDQNVIELHYRDGKGLDYVIKGLDYVININGQALDKWAAPKIMETTNIPNQNDALRFLHGDIKNGFICWSIANMTKEANKIFDKHGLGSINFTYEEAKAVTFGDPVAEQQYIDEVWNKFKADHPDAPESLKESIQDDAKAYIRNEAKKNLQYKIMDGYLIDKVDENIPLGFSKTMYEGTWEERTNMLGSYTVALATKGVVSISTEDINHLRNGEYSQMSSSFYGSMENYLNLGEKLGFKMQSGTIKALFTVSQGWAQNNNALRDQGLNSLKQIYTDWGTSKVFNWFDKQTGAPIGTAYNIYETYKTYKSAVDAYEAAREVNDAAKLAEASANLENVKIDAVNFVVQLAFGKTFSKIDSQIGLPPGTTSALVTLLLTGSPISLIIVAIVNLFSEEVHVYGSIPVCRSSVSPDDPGYMSQIKENVLGESNRNAIMAGGIFSIQGAVLDVFFGAKVDMSGFQEITGNPDIDFPFYQEHAQCSVKRLIGALLSIGEVTGHEEYLPTQTLTLNPDDAGLYIDKINKYYGESPIARGLSGVLSSDMFSQYVHVGY